MSYCTAVLFYRFQCLPVQPILVIHFIVEALDDGSGGVTPTRWIICGSVVAIVMLTTMVIGIICHKKCHSKRNGTSDTRSEDPSVITEVTDNNQLHLGQYSFGNLPDLPSPVGRLPNPSPDLLEGAMGPAVPIEDQASGYSRQNKISVQKEGVPPPLYDQDENDEAMTDAKPPSYSP